MNTLGSRLVSLLNAPGLRILNGRFAGDKSIALTRIYQKAVTIIDYTTVFLVLFEFIGNFIIEVQEMSDHNLQTVTLYLNQISR
ncbi:hypothetical protein NDU88_005691 [Pleurodeles waltl]|uniref:Uncharacterized protein n=1 Tax=Pleurodeles waltl TaxID=8319 RepID=A0AAV7QJ02_PLEWA|nr:hypothetical protein NDU88_005691 [Pleurodeles waltl]